jgi:hypothetical protein
MCKDMQTLQSWNELLSTSFDCVLFNRPGIQRLDLMISSIFNGHRGDLGSRALGCLSAQVGDRPREKGSQADNRKTYGERRKTVSAMKLETSFFDFFLLWRDVKMLVLSFKKHHNGIWYFP